MTSNKFIILTAGGTGGHVYPAEAVAEELTSRGYDIALVTDKRGKNNYKGTLGEIKNYAVLGGALVGKSKLFKIQSLIKTGLGVLQSIYLIFKLKPACVVGFGGYASFPCSFAAIITRTPLIIHEQNSVMSRTNRFLSKYATLIAQSFRNVKFTPQGIKTVLTGMPIRKSIAEVRNLSRPKLDSKNKFQLFILGGSQGAKIFSDVIPKAIKSFDENIQSKFRIYQQCREVDLKDVTESYKNSKAELFALSFFNNMPEMYVNSHLIISRAGASSVSEIAAVGIPSILVPFAAAADDHQTYNAKELGSMEGSIVISQKNFTVEKAIELLTELLNNPEKLSQMSENAKKVGITDAAKRFADAIEKEVNLK